MRIYLAVLLMAIGYYPFMKVSLLTIPHIELIHTGLDQLQYQRLNPEEHAQLFKKLEDSLGADYHILAVTKEPILDSTHPVLAATQWGALTWGPQTQLLQERVSILRKESPIFDKVLSNVEASEYPIYVFNKELDGAIGAFSIRTGELLFNPSKMLGFLFDATIIEEFVHAYQANFYNYAFGDQKQKGNKGQPYSENNWALDANGMDALRNWENIGRKQAYIESEAKLITFLVQNEAASISLQQIVDLDDYNSGGKARSLLLPYWQQRNCIKLRRTEKIDNLEDSYIDTPTFFAYQKGFVRYWRRLASGTSYTVGKLRQQPAALNALTIK